MSKYSLKKKENVISPENAQKQVMMLLERYGIDLDEMEVEKSEALETTIDNVKKCVIFGSLDIFEDKGEVKVKLILQNISEKNTIKELVFGEVRGKDHIAMKNKGNEQSKMLSLLSSMCETNGGFAAIEQLRSSDLTNAEYLSLLFL